MKRMQSRLRLIALMMSLTLALVFGGCVQPQVPAPSSSQQQVSSQTTPVKVRFGYQQTVWGSPAMLAVAKNVWEGYNIEVEPLVFTAGKDARDALIGGSVDIASIGATPLIVGAANYDLVTIGTVAYAGDTLALVAAKDAGINTVADLKGKKIASRVGTSTDYAFQHLVAPAFGLSPDDYQIVNTSFNDHVSALASGSVDAFAGVEPYNTLAVHEGIGVVLARFGAYDPSPLFLITSRDWVEKNPEAAVDFLKGWLKVVEIFNTDPDEVKATMIAAFKQAGYDLPDEVVAQSLAGMHVSLAYRPDLKAYLTNQAQALVDAGSIDAVPDWDKVLLTEPLNKALGK